MRVRYIETIVRWMDVELDDQDWDQDSQPDELEREASEIAHESVQLYGWDGENCIESKHELL